jgi:four helix bundle protein
MHINDYRDLIVWQKSVDLTERVYDIVKHFPACERYGLSSQMTRAAISVASNIAEGNASSHRAQYIRYLGVARGSLFELATQVEIATRLAYIPATRAARVFTDVEAISRMLRRLQARLREGAHPRPLPSSLRRPQAAASRRAPKAPASLTPNIAP